MSDELLRFYNSELQHLHRQGDEFAKAHPQVAAHLRFGSEGEHDPYVGRLVEAFAYLNARTRQKLEDEFPELAGSILDIVLPHYQRQIPSAFIAQVNLDDSQNEQYSGYTIAAGSTIETEAIEGEPCRFRTCYAVTCWPFHIASAQLRGVPFESPKFVLPAQPLGLFKVTLKTASAEIPFSRFETKWLRFFIPLKAPFSYQLYELLLNDLLGVSAASSATDPSAVDLPAEVVQPVGFGVDEGLVDYPAHSFPGYRLISEYFALPEKFLFVDVDVSKAVRRQESSQLELYFFLRKRWPELEPQISLDCLKLGCTPIVNLFKHRAEPIRLSHFDSNFTVVPDSRRPRAHEVYAIESVTGVSSKGELLKFEPFYSFRHGSVGKARAFWHATRREVVSNDALERGTELEIAFVDLDFHPPAPGDWTIDVETICTNRNLPARISFGGGQPRLQLEGGGAIENVIALTQPTAPLRTPLGQGLRWRAVSHLSLNHISLTNDQQGATALREILSLYDFRGDETTANSVAGLLRLSAKPILGRVPGDRSGALCRGLEVMLYFDEEKYSAGNVFLFASILERFFALYCNINSFTQAAAVSNRRPGVFHRWPARAGTQVLA